MKVISKVALLAALIVAVSGVMSAATAVPNRIAGNPDGSVAFLKDNVHRFARAEFDRGKVDDAFPMQRITMGFKLSAAQQADLESLLQQQADPTSPNYHKWLTPAEYGKRFGLSDADYGKVTAWLKANGFEIVDAPASRTLVTFNGTAAQVEAALRTEIRRYVVNGESHYANATSPAVPAAFASVVLGFASLNDFRPKPMGIIKRKLNPNFTSSISGSHFLTPSDLATIYNVGGLYSAGYTGTGQKIVVVGQSNVNMADITAFRTAAGLSTTNLPTLTLVPGSDDPGIVNGDVDEASLDLEWTGGIAKDAKIIYVFSKDGVFDSLQYSITNNLAPVISISYGACESSFSAAESQLLNQLAQQANTQGITLIASSGDSGAAACDYDGGSTKITSATHGLAVSLPASLPGVTAIGGTTFNEGTGTYWDTSNNSNGGSALSYIPEVVWNDTALDGDLMATGGGKSTLFAKPSWQTGAGVPADSARDLPDISLAASPAHDPYLICSQGRCVNGFRDASDYLDTIGGTSAGAPVFAGMLALINQKTASTQGNINSKLYELAASAPSAFHDITSGDNNVPCTSGTTDCASGGTIGYSAGVGYDLATGLGSIDVSALAAALTPQAVGSGTFVLSSVTDAVTVSAGAPVSLTVVLKPINGFDGPVTWSCSVSSELSTLAACSMTPDASSPYRRAAVTITSTKVAAGLQKSNVSLVFAMLAFPMGVLVIGGKKHKKAVYAVLGVAIVSIGLLSTGCGGGGSKTTTPVTPVQTGVTGLTVIRATSGTVSSTITIPTTVR